MCLGLDLWIRKCLRSYNIRPMDASTKVYACLIHGTKWGLWEVDLWKVGCRNWDLWHTWAHLQKEERLDTTPPSPNISRQITTTSHMIGLGLVNYPQVAKLSGWWIMIMTQLFQHLMNAMLETLVCWTRNRWMWPQAGFLARNLVRQCCLRKAHWQELHECVALFAMGWQSRRRCSNE